MYHSNVYTANVQVVEREDWHQVGRGRTRKTVWGTSSVESLYLGIWPKHHVSSYTVNIPGARLHLQMDVIKRSEAKLQQGAAYNTVLVASPRSMIHISTYVSVISMNVISDKRLPVRSQISVQVPVGSAGYKWALMRGISIFIWWLNITGLASKLAH